MLDFDCIGRDMHSFDKSMLTMPRPKEISQRLTPKIPSVFGPIFAVSDLVGGFHFSTKKKM
jgi:hypothetical protein